jgi:hypothetical protein
MDTFRFQAGAVGLKLVTTLSTQERFGHLAAGGIAGAKKEDTLFGVHKIIPLSSRR